MFQLVADPTVIEVNVPVNFNRTSVSETEMAIRRDEVDSAIVVVNGEVVHSLYYFFVSRVVAVVF